MFITLLLALAQPDPALPTPLTVSPAGFFWQSAKRPLDVRVYGEFGLPARWDPETQSTVDINERQMLSWSDYWKLYKEGKWQAAVGARPRSARAA